MGNYTMYLVSAPEGEELTVTNGFSLLVGANSAIRNHSLPLNESSSGLMGVEAGVSFLY